MGREHNVKTYLIDVQHVWGQGGGQRPAGRWLAGPRPAGRRPAGRRPAGRRPAGRVIWGQL